MKFSKLFTQLAATSALAMAMGLSGSAHANVYAVSYLDIDEIIVSFEPDANVTLLASLNLSEANAKLNGASDTQGGAGFTDSPVAGLGTPTRTNNAFNIIGVQPTEYSNSDAWIPFDQVQGDPYTQTISIAEANLTQNGSLASADAQNSSASFFSVNLIVNSPTTMSLIGLADPFMQVLLSADAAIGSLSIAEIALTATLTNNDTGQVVFDWSPDGVVAPGGGGCLGCVAEADPFSLNRNLTVGLPDTTITYDPGGDNFFGAISDTLIVGNYTLDLAMRSDVFLKLVRNVPEPSTIALLGLGMMGLGLKRRRKATV